MLKEDNITYYYPGGWWRAKCNACGKIFKGGRPSNGPGRRWAKTSIEFQARDHECVPSPKCATFAHKKNNSMETFVITKVDDQGDRVLFYGHPKWDNYHVVAPAGTSANIGDKVQYKPEGYNFGWFVRIVA